MFKLASTFARTGVIALGVLTGFGGMAITAPLGPIDRPALPVSSNLPVELAQGEFRGGTNPILRPVSRRRTARGGVNRAWRGGTELGRQSCVARWQKLERQPCVAGQQQLASQRQLAREGNWKGRNWKGRGHYRNYHDYDDDDDSASSSALACLLSAATVSIRATTAATIRVTMAGTTTRYYGTGNAHESWCYSRYRSYRAWDNTYQPYYGPRRECFSPYD